ncbi:hypothetical protein F2Q68_00045489 [Brassica cretica]|uniref:Uncharacterized protein n=1 Tax=Brassica cretica TaxID=69181 RepID=A0A8S9LKB1_BRACR|nr:hypothetical protein F2Q68_00045489 [Brassica cretica]
MALGKKRFHLEAVDVVALDCPQDPSEQHRTQEGVTKLETRDHHAATNHAFRRVSDLRSDPDPEAYINKSDLVRVPERPKMPSISVYFDGEDQSNPDTTNKEERREEEAKDEAECLNRTVDARWPETRLKQPPRERAFCWRN